MFTIDLNPGNTSTAARASAEARIGPMSGETTIAPMTTAGLFNTSPSVAIPAERINSSQ